VFVSVAVPVPQLDLLTYAVPEGVRPPAIGARVVVPLGTRAVTGIVVDSRETAGPDVSPDLIKPLKQILDDRPFVPSDVVELAQWTAEYYGAGAGATIVAVLPPKTRGNRADAHKTERVVTATPAGLASLASAAAPGAERKRGSTANVALQLLSRAPDGLRAADLKSHGVSAGVVARLSKLGYVSIARARVERDPFAGSAATLRTSPDLKAGPTYREVVGRRLTEEQTCALSRLRELARSGRFHVAVLHGVTGSGKTEVYVRLAADVRQSGRQVLMLVPEIALTPAVATIFREAFGDRVAIQHSGLSDGERHDQWQRIRNGDVDLVIGTRSAVFAPCERVGLIVVDEEHDASYKQEETPRYHARDVAIVRGQKAGALVVLGSATPALESYANALSGKYDRVTMMRRILDRPLPAVTVVDMRGEFAAEGPDVILSRRLREALELRIERREQAIVLLNRRGFATAVFCRQCAGTLDCPNCSVSLVVHGQEASRRARCHYCNFSMRIPAACPTCAGPYLEQTGYGTQRVEDEVRRLLPAARVARLDRDAVRRKGSLSSLLTRFRDGEIDVLVGTQMMAKGHDFPRVTLVGVISADVGLGMADFRASERTFQLLTQVAGRAGRGDEPGEAVIQTLYPEHYSIQLACRQDYPAFYHRELTFRRAMRYPPFVSLVNITVRAKTMSAALRDAEAIADRLRAADESQDSYRVLGPAPAALARLRGEYRSQILVKATKSARRMACAQVVETVSALPGVARRTTVDVDPLSVL